MKIPDSGFNRTIQEIRELKNSLYTKEKKEDFLVDSNAVRDAFRRAGRILVLAIDGGGVN